MELDNIIQEKNKRKFQTTFIESDNSDEEKIQLEPSFQKFIIYESLEDTSLTKLSSFLTQKIISANISPKTVKILRNGTIMIETENKKHTNFLLNMKIFRKFKIKTYPYKTLNSSKGVIRNKELSHCSREEILAELKNKA